MSIFDTYVNCFEELKIFALSDVSVDLVAESEFTEEDEIDLKLEKPSLKILHKCIKLIRNSVKNKSTETIWNVIIEKKLSLKHIQVWLFGVILQGLKENASFVEKDACIMAANMYYLMLSLAGSNREYFFHCIVFEKSLNAFDMAGSLNKHPLKRKADMILTQQKKKSRQDKTTNTTNQTLMEAEADISNEELSTLLDHTKSSVLSLNYLLHTMSLREHKVSFTHVIRALVRMLSHFGKTMSSTLTEFNLNLESVSLSEHDNIMSLIYHAVFLMLSPKHGNIENTSLIVLKRLLSTVLMQETVVFTSIPKAYIYSSNSAFNFILSMFCKSENETVLQNFRDFLQNVIVQNPDRAEYRNHMAEAVGRLILQMPHAFYSEFSAWLVRTLKHARLGYRSNALIVIGQLLCQPEHENTETNVDCSTSHKSLLQVVMHRMVDVAASVRVRALGVIVEIMQNQIVPVETFLDAANTSNVLQSVVTDISPSTEINFEVGGIFSCILRHCASWNKSQVRKSSISAIENALINKYLPICHENILILEERCRDPALIVRKQTVQSLTNVLLSFPEKSDVTCAWARGILPRVIDPETTVQEKVMASVEKVIFNGLLNNISENEIIMAWNVLSYFGEPESNGTKLYLENLCAQWLRKYPGDVSIAVAVTQSLNNESRQSSAWLFLDILTRHACNKSLAKDICDCYNSQRKNVLPLPMRMNMITTLGNISKCLSDETKNDLVNEFKDCISSFLWPIQLISSTMETLRSLTSSDKTISETFVEWCSSLLPKCEKFIFEAFKNTGQNIEADSKKLINYITVAGCSGLYIPKQIPKLLRLYMQALLTGVQAEEVVAPSQVSSSQHPISQDIASQPITQFQHTVIPDNVKAHLILNLGKMSYFKPGLAKKLVPAMVRELENSNSEMVRSNVLMVLTDMCVLHTQLVDPYITEMATCLRDESRTVRKHAVTLLTKLLRKEFVKWRGSLLYKYLVCTCDSDSEIKSLARFAILEQLLTKNAGDMFFRHFLETIFYLNSFEHGSYNKFLKSEREITLFDLSSNTKLKKRMEIYNLMLDKMEDDHRIKLTSKLCEDILGAVVDGAIPLNRKTENILSDTLAILCSKNIKLKCLQTAPEDDPDLEEIASTQKRNAEKVQQEIKRGFVTQVVKRNLVENIIPIIISLKNFLSEKKSRLMADIMLFLKEIMQDYKTEVQDILSCDKQLASEIEFDLKRFDRQQQEKEERLLAEKLLQRQQLASNPPSAPRTPLPSSPGSFTPSRVRSSASSRRKTISSLQALSSNSTTPVRRRTMSSRELLKSAQTALIKLKLQENVSGRKGNIETIPEKGETNIVETRENLGVISTEKNGTKNAANDLNQRDDAHQEMDTDNDGGQENVNIEAEETIQNPDGRGMSTPSKQNAMMLTFSQNDHSRILSPINQK